MTSPELAPIAFGLLSAATWGAGDFSGGLASRRSPVYSVIISSQIIGLMLLTALAIISREAAPALEGWGWGALAGVSGAVGLIALYRALAIGSMGVAAPVSAVVSVALPVIFGAFVEGLPTAWNLAGFGLAMAAIWLISRSGTGFDWRDLGTPLLAGLGFAGFFIAVDRASDTAVYWPLVAARSASLILMLGLATVTRQSYLADRAQWWLIGLCALGEVGGNVFYGLAAQAGRLDVVAVLASLYPASTVALAWAVLKERLTRPQWLGVGAALVAIVLIAL